MANIAVLFAWIKSIGTNWFELVWIKNLPIRLYVENVLIGIDFNQKNLKKFKICQNNQHLSKFSIYHKFQNRLISETLRDRMVTDAEQQVITKLMTIGMHCFGAQDQKQVGKSETILADLKFIFIIIY